jgi:hypothetical protein
VLAVAAGPAGELYERALVALAEALGEAGDEHWRTWMRADVEIWRTSRRSGHHRQAFGGMGSFSDRGALGDPWVEASIAQLAHITRMTARQAEETPGRHVQVSGTFIYGVQLHLRRCAKCGQELVEESQLTQVAAAGWSSWAIPRMVTDGTVAAREPYVRFVEQRANGLRRRTVVAPCPVCGGSQWENAVVAVW